MPTQLTFDYHFSYGSHLDGIILPAVLTSGDLVVRTKACVDTGAAYCVFTNEVGIELGLDIESGIPKLMGSAAGGYIETFGHEVGIQTLDVSFDSYIYFARYPGLRRNLLGRHGWLRNLRVALIDYDNLFYYGRYDA
jgi:hypothetical protein